MAKKSNSNNRKEIKSKLANALGEKMESLSAGYKEILLDDLATAFESRLAVFRRATCVQFSIHDAQMVEVSTV